MKSSTLPLELQRLAYFPGLRDHLFDLADMAYPEGWQYKNPRFDSAYPEMEILLKYLRAVYRKHALDYNEASDEYMEDLSVFVDGKFICFHTGLYTRDYRAIYALFRKGDPRDRSKLCGFIDFILEDDAWLEALEVKPDYPVFPAAAFADAFYLDWPVDTAFRQIAQDREMLAYLPEPLREEDTLRRGFQRALSRARRNAEQIPYYAAPLVYNERVQYALPLHMTEGDRPDMAVVLVPLENLSYRAHHLLLPEMVYNNARLLGFVQAGWLQDMVIQPPLEMPVLAPEDGRQIQAGAG